LSQQLTHLQATLIAVISGAPLIPKMEKICKKYEWQ